MLTTHRQIATVFLDVKKAFDSVPHPRLIKSLSKIGIQGPLLTWFKDYLSGRSQQVVLDGVTSDPVAVTSGVPQGSILGLLLFNIFMNSITTVPLSTNSHLVLYADDILLFKPINNTSDLLSLQSDIQNILKWLSTNGLTPNDSKTQLLPITRSRNQPTITISVNGHTISPCQSVKYLGVTLTQNLTWSLHINNICKSSKRQLGLIHRKLRHAPSKLRHQIYRTTTLPTRILLCCLGPTSASPQTKPGERAKVCSPGCYHHQLDCHLFIALFKTQFTTSCHPPPYPEAQTLLQYPSQPLLHPVRHLYSPPSPLPPATSL